MLVIDCLKSAVFCSFCCPCFGGGVVRDGAMDARDLKTSKKTTTVFQEMNFPANFGLDPEPTKAYDLLYEPSKQFIYSNPCPTYNGKPPPPIR